MKGCCFKALLAKYSSVFKYLEYNQRQLNIVALQRRKTSKNEILGSYETQMRVRTLCLQQFFCLIPLKTPISMPRSV